MADMEPSTELSIDELRWLEASALIDLPALPSPRLSFDVDDHYFRMKPSPESLVLKAEQMSKSKPYQAELTPRSHCILGPPVPVVTPSPSKSVSRPRTPPRSSFSASLLPSPPLTPPRRDSPSRASPTEWIYRQPRTPPKPRPRNVSPASAPRPRPRPQTGYQAPTVASLSRSASNSSTRSNKTIGAHTRGRVDASNNGTAPFWSTILRPRSRSERSIPLLKTIPSQPQIVLAPTLPTYAISTLSTSTMSSTASKPIDIRPPSITSTLSSTSASTATSSSRPGTPTSPLFPPPSSPYVCHKFHRPYHRRYATDPTQDPRLPPLSASCPPSKSILTRTSSISTKNSSTAASNKSVKFVEMATVHYASTGYWDVKTLDQPPINDESITMGVDMDGMDMDISTESQTALGKDLTFAEDGEDVRLNRDEMRELHCMTPTPEREKSKSLKRFVSLSRKLPSAPISSETAPQERPSISGPYALGAFSGLTPPTQSTKSFKCQLSKPNARASTSPYGGVPLRTAPSLESFRSAKSYGGKSVRSLGSVKSTASTRGFRSWLSRLGMGAGWSTS
ncbi:hypothetical protein BDQ12DRAFT_720634 [Crucibulum laeve]|uniref:Uncharacterized protein n=1 Tax=Crucibulum laeve TaxID=68775 RepID=A0A5C3MAT5_9AGAR|nr:hypothetical protein BDQ12DRAFT_720634 [Crucibulum laeve]